MTLAPTYACFGCVDFANNARLKTYVAWACATGKFSGDATGAVIRTRGLCECDADGSDFVDPITDEVCWYDPRIPESEDFLGVAIVESEGIRSSSYKRELNSALNGGSVLGLPTIDGKQMMLKVELFATSPEGMNYGIQWLRSQFEGDPTCQGDGSSCASCQGQLLTLRVHCPTDDDRLDGGLHSWAAAGTIDGFEPIDDEFPLGRRNCEKATAGTITLGTESRNSYSTQSVASVSVDTSGAFQMLGACDLAPLIVDDSCTVDPGCDLVEIIELVPEVIGGDTCFGYPVCSCVAAVEITDLPAGYDTALRITLFSGLLATDPVFSKYGMRNAVIRIFENPATAVGETDYPDGLPLPTDEASFDLLTSKQLPCAEIGVSWIPPAAELVIDGLSGQTWLKCKGECFDHSNRVEVLSGSIFPLRVKCTSLIITMEWDCLNNQADPAGELSSMTVESFLGFRL